MHHRSTTADFLLGIGIGVALALALEAWWGGDDVGVNSPDYSRVMGANNPASRPVLPAHCPRKTTRTRPSPGPVDAPECLPGTPPHPSPSRALSDHP